VAASPRRRWVCRGDVARSIALGSMCWCRRRAAARKGKLPRLCPIYAPFMPRFNAALGRGCDDYHAPFYWLPAPAVGNPCPCLCLCLCLCLCPCETRTAGEKHRGFSAARILIHTLPTSLKGQPPRLQLQGEHPRFSSPTGEPQQLEAWFIVFQLSLLCKDLQRCFHKWGEELSPREQLENICESTTFLNKQN
jgi:hypothetical protein